MSMRYHVTGAVVTLVILSGLPAPADGGFIPVVHGVANSADQRAVVIDHGGRETIVLQTAYQGDATDFAWVIPLPALISASEAVGTADPAVFDALNEITGPRYFGGHYGRAGLYGCAGDDRQPREEDGVVVWEVLRVEDYEVAVLSAEQSSDLASWLGQNGYGMPGGSEETLQYYVDKQWFFVALKIAPADGAADGSAGSDEGRLDGTPGQNEVGEELRPITLSFPTDQVIFPLHISRVSTRERVEVLIYVIAPHRMQGANYDTTPMDAPATYAGDDFARDYDAWFEETIADAGGKTLVVEYAGVFPQWRAEDPLFADLLAGGRDYWVTRLRTRLGPEQMDEDIVMAAAADEHFEVVVGDAFALLRGGSGIAMLLLACVQGLAWRSTRGRRFASAAALCGVLIILL